MNCNQNCVRSMENKEPTQTGWGMADRTKTNETETESHTKKSLAG